MGVGPAQFRIAQEFGDARGHLRQHRLQHDGQLTEQDQRGRADVVQFGRFGLVLGQDPWLVFIDVLVDDVGDFHDFAQCAAILARLEAGGHRCLALGAVVHQRLADPVAAQRRDAVGQLAVKALGDEAGAAAGDIHVLADQVAVDAGHEVVAVEVQVFHLRVELEGQVVAQPLRIHAQLEIAQRRDAGAARLGHFFIVHRQVAVDGDLQVVDDRVAREIEHRRPEQQVERDNILADEVQLLGGRVVQERLDIQTLLVEVVLQAGQVADRRVQPHIEELARCIGNRDAEVGRVARDIPVGQLFTGLAQPLRHLVDHFRLQAARGVEPFLEEREAARVGQLEEVLLRRLEHGRGAGEDRERVDQFGWLVGGAADFAVVAVLVLGVAYRALALDVAVGQEHALDRIVEAVDGLGDDQAGIAQLAVDALREFDVFGRIGGIPVIEGDMEAIEILRAAGGDLGHEFLRRDVFFFGSDHDRRAVRIVGADEMHFAFLAALRIAFALHSLEADPDVGLDVLHHVADMEGSIGVGQCGGDEQLAGHG